MIDCIDASISETEVAGEKDLRPVCRLLIISLLGSMYYIQILYLLLLLAADAKPSLAPWLQESSSVSIGTVNLAVICQDFGRYDSVIAIA